MKLKSIPPRPKGQHGNLFVKYFTSFFCIILIPTIVFCAFLYYFISQRMDMELDARLDSTARAFATQMDTMLIQLEGEVTSLALEMDTSDLTTTTLNHESKMQLLAELRKHLVASTSINRVINTIGVYFGSDQKAMSQKGYYSQSGELDWAPIQLLMDSTQINGIHVLKKESGSVQIIIGKSIPIYQKKGRNFAYCTLQEDILDEYIHYGWDQAESFITDAQGNVLVASRPNHMTDASLFDLNGTLNASDNRFKQVPSNVMPWQYYVSISNEYAGLDIGRFLWALLFIALALCGLGVAFSYMLAHAFYKPISELAHAARMELSKINGKEVASSPDEIAFINQAVSDISAYSTALEQCLDNGRIRVLTSVFAHLLEGSAMSHDEVSEILENYTYVTANRQFNVFVAELKSGDIDQKWDGWLARYHLETCMRSILKNCPNCEVTAVEMEKYRLCGIISYDSQQSPPDQKLFEQMLPVLIKQWPCARLAAGGTANNIMEISQPYCKAVRALAGAPARQTTGVVEPLDNVALDISTPRVKYRWLESVANNILIEDRLATEKMVQSLWDHMVLTENATLAGLTQSAMQITAYLSVVLQERMPEVSGWPSPITMESAAYLRHAGDVLKSVLTFCDEAITGIQAETHRQAGSKILQAVQFADEHYTQDISLTQIADLMDITPQYLSSIFKMQVGKNFTEYINHKRLEESARLLKQGNLSVQQISETVGYNSVQYFARKFKEAFGITPSQYRESTPGDE